MLVSLLYLFTFNFGEVAFSKREDYHPYSSGLITAEALTFPATEGWKGCDMRAKRSMDPELNVEQKGGSCRQEREDLRSERRRKKVTGEGLCLNMDTNENAF